jgi:hypothetical protein
MGNRRVIIFLLSGIAVCALLMWGAQRRVRFIPAQSKVKMVLLDHPLETVDAVTVERGDTRIGLRRQGGRWDMVAPFPARVDQGAVLRLLDAFEAARVTDALSFQELRRRDLSLREFGLYPAHTHVTLGGPQQADKFFFGAFSPLGAEVYVRMNQMEQILVVPAGLYTALPHTADDIRSRKLVHADRALLRTVELRVPGRPFIKLSKETGAWRLVQPAPAPASDPKVEGLLDVLYAARVERFVWPTVSNVMDVAEAESAFKARMSLYGFGADTGLQVQMQEAGAEPPVKIVFGQPLDSADGLTYVLLQGGEAIGAVSNAVPEALRPLPSDLRDTRLFYEMSGSVRRLQVYFGDLLFVLSQTNALWRLDAPVADVADQAVVRDTVERVLRLNAETIDDDATSEARSVRAEQNVPISHVEFFSDQASWRFTISTDDAEGAYYRVTVTNSPTVFRVASSNMPPALVSMIGLLGLRDKTVLAIKSQSIRRVTVRRGEGAGDTLQREKDSAVWRLGEGLAGQVSKEHVSALLALLEALKADRIEKLGLELDELDTYGLRVPWLEVSVDVDAADAVRKTLLIGKDAGFGKRYAMVRGLDVLFVMGAEELARLSARLADPL